MWIKCRYQCNHPSRKSTKSLQKELEHHGSGQATRRKQIFTSIVPNKRFPDSLFHHSTNSKTMSLPPSTANWHWKNKNCTRWGTEWLKRELTTLTVTSDKPEETVFIKKVSEVDGDIELGQRKSK